MQLPAIVDSAARTSRGDLPRTRTCQKVLEHYTRILRTRLHAVLTHERDTYAVEDLDSEI